MSRLVLADVGNVLGLVGAVLVTIGLVLALVRAITVQRWQTRINAIVAAIGGLYGVQGDALEPLWNEAAPAIAKAVAEILGARAEFISVKPRHAPGGPKICGALVILRGPASLERPDVVAQLQREVRTALPAWAYFQTAVATDGVPLPLDRLTKKR